VVLASVASQSGTPAFICVAAVQALARATRFASACVFMLDEWRCNDAEPHEAPSATVARLLLSPQRAKLAQHAVTVLQHCHVCCLAWHVRAAADDDEVEVRSMVLQPRGEPIQLNYRMEKTAAGWKIYDVNILGAWLVETYKGTFSAEIGKSGIDGLIKALAERNKRLAAAPPKQNKS
jgi:hypothetical protein